MSKIDIFKFVKDTDAFSAGEVICKEGEPGSTMYVIQEGEVDVVVGDRIFETVGAGGIVGEMALIEPSENRSATVVAKSDCQVVTLNEEEFLNHIHRTPFFALQVMRIITMRLRKMNEEVSGE